MSAPRRTLIAVACLLLLAGAAAFAFRYAPGSRAAMPKPVVAVPVNVARVVLKTVPVRLRAIGNVEPFTTVAVKARIDGQIVAVHFKEGDEVHKGDTLFEIDRRPLQAQLQQAQANLLKDRALLDHANEQDKRYKDLLEKKFVSPDAYAQIRTNSETAAAQVSADQAAIESARLQLDYCTIRSPITGYAGKIQIQEGNLVKANDTFSLVVINQVVPINASFSVPEQSLSAVRKYQADGELQVTAQVPNSGFAPVVPRSSVMTFLRSLHVRHSLAFTSAIATFVPGASRSCPTVTTVSPGLTPEATTAKSPSLRATLTSRMSTVPSGLTMNTYWPFGPF